MSYIGTNQSADVTEATMERVPLISLYVRLALYFALNTILAHHLDSGAKQLSSLNEAPTNSNSHLSLSRRSRSRKIYTVLALCLLTVLCERNIWKSANVRRLNLFRY